MLVYAPPVQIEAKEQELEAAEAQLTKLREDLSDRQGEVAAAQGQLRDMGVPEADLHPDHIRVGLLAIKRVHPDYAPVLLPLSIKGNLDCHEEEADDPYESTRPRGI